jgi:hypothetical protein
MESPLAAHRATPTELQARLDAERQGEPFLVWRNGDGEQRIDGLGPARERLTIGRREDNDIALPWDTEVSRLHALIERVAGEWTIVDDGLSQNGTFVNGQRLSTRRRLQDGDLVRAGRTAVAFVDPRAGTSSATSVAGDALATLELTTMQKRVLIALCRPFADPSPFAAPATNQQIAAELFLSIDGVKTHMRSLFRKFELGDLPHNQKRMLLAERAMGAGVITPKELR